MLTRNKSFARRIGVSQQADFEERKLIVLREAVNAFQQYGISKTKISDICERLNVTKPTIYHYVGNKENMVIECLKIARRRLRGFGKEINAQNLIALEKLHKLLETYSEVVMDDFGRFILSLDVKQLSPKAKGEFAKSRKEFIRYVTQILAEGNQQGTIKCTEPHTAAMCIIGAFNFLPNWLNKDAANANEVFEEFINIFLRGLKT